MSKPTSAVRWSLCALPGFAGFDEDVDTEAADPSLPQAFEAGPTDDYDLRVLPGASHAFFATTDGVSSYITG